MAVKPQKGVRSVEEFKTQLHRHGLKATRPRIAVHTVMMDLVQASPDQVVERFREAGVKDGNVQMEITREEYLG